MAENDDQGQDKTEEATPERREEFREKGQVAVSREISSVFLLASSTVIISYYMTYLNAGLQEMLASYFRNASTKDVSVSTFVGIMYEAAMSWIWFVVPIFAVTTAVAVFATFFQTRFNWSWKRLTPDFKRLDPLSGIKRMANTQALMELGKGIGKMTCVGTVTYLILYSEWDEVPSLLNVPLINTWIYWATISKQLFWSVAGFLLFIALGDYLYNFNQIEQKLRMTKQEVKEEMKRREVDQYVKARIKRMQRDIAMAKMIQDTRTSTVLITNPTHFSIALRYEQGMNAPVVVAKAKDNLALRLREIAKEHDVPIVENKPLARTLYKVCEIGQEIPESLYKAASEVIKYVFRLKGRKFRGS